MAQLADFVKDATTTTGTGTITLDATATTGYHTFAAAFGTGLTQNIRYVIRSEDGADWEVGLGTLNGTAQTLTRERVHASSNAGALVSFAAGTKGVYVAAVAEDIKQGSSGRVLAQARGWAMP